MRGSVRTRKPHVIHKQSLLFRDFFSKSLLFRDFFSKSKLRQNVDVPNFPKSCIHPKGERLGLSRQGFWRGILLDLQICRDHLSSPTYSHTHTLTHSNISHKILNDMFGGVWVYSKVLVWYCTNAYCGIDYHYSSVHLFPWYTSWCFRMY